MLECEGIVVVMCVWKFGGGMCVVFDVFLLEMGCSSSCILWGFFGDGLGREGGEVK